jgi:hypothetical protein
VTIGIIAALVVGKPVGIVLATWLTESAASDLTPRAEVVDTSGVGLLAGIGFTVSLLRSPNKLHRDRPHHDHAKVAILLASVVAAVIASALLASQNRATARSPRTTRKTPTTTASPTSTIGRNSSAPSDQKLPGHRRGSRASPHHPCVRWRL